MVALREPNYITPQEYLEWEETAETKSEYHDGVIVAMAGADPEHNKITFDIPVTLDRNCVRQTARVSAAINAYAFRPATNIFILT